jgi:hypothetical protein
MRLEKDGVLKHLNFIVGQLASRRQWEVQEETLKGATIPYYGHRATTGRVPWPRPNHGNPTGMAR